ncbi:hypothetical protein [Bacillus sp. SG-1]|uniref:hypothetical protein n=1 Tax=Bacillus sp. SG-1 TaxID=161544 RepID=UPI0012E9B739|nr:hypothetical protein [Bacillus sp. SG-1]
MAELLFLKVDKGFQHLKSYSKSKRIIVSARREWKVVEDGEAIRNGERYGSTKGGYQSESGC